ncbi:hypothetical protein KKG61_07300 [bacterium]|nr:hypothetical protein [bacterium]MBU1599892.1 hypothetical protein [bacterium]MBU2461355.1 hypothetical protein [bacterium]
MQVKEKQAFTQPKIWPSSVCLKNDSGQNISKGIYYIKLKAGGFSATKAMVVEQ